MSDKQRLERIRSALETAFSPTRLSIEDDSLKHAGHAGSAAHGGGHFSIAITSASFAGKSRMQCHRMVMEVMKPMFSDDIHALSIRTSAP